MPPYPCRKSHRGDETIHGSRISMMKSHGLIKRHLDNDKPSWILHRDTTESRVYQSLDWTGFYIKVAFVKKKTCYIFNKCNDNQQFNSSLLGGLSTPSWLFHDDVIKWKLFPRYWTLSGGFAGEFPTLKPVTWSFDVFFDLRIGYMFELTISRLVILDAIASILTSL